MAAPVAKTALDNGRARLAVCLSAAVRDRLARAAFEAGKPVSALVEEAVQRALDAADAPELQHERPQARWVHKGPASDWAADGVAYRADERGALLTVRPEDGRWAWKVQAARALLLGGPLASRTAAMLEAETQAAVLPAEGAAAAIGKRVRRKSGARSD